MKCIKMLNIIKSGGREKGINGGSRAQCCGRGNGKIEGLGRGEITKH